jgi:hypothetical protein
MRRTPISLCLCLAVLLPAGAKAADKPLSLGGETAAEKQRQALERVLDLEIADLPLDRAVNQLREQTGINFVLDKTAIPGNALFDPTTGQPLNPLQGQLVSGYNNLRLSVLSHGAPVRSVVSKMLRAHNLAHVLVGDTVYITTKEKAIERQLGQEISVNIEATPLSDALKRLARETGANLVLDPGSTKAGQTALTLRLDEVPLETAVEVLADEAGLRVVRLSNVLYVTSEARAEKLRKPPAVATAPAAGWQVWPDGKGGFRLTPPAGAGIGGGGGLAGFGGGLAGLGGGIGGLGGMMGALGVGGGFQGMAGGAVKPVPLTPPLPKAKQPAPGKPKTEKLPAKPAVKPPTKDKPAPKGKPAAEALPSRTNVPRSRRRRSVV